MRLRQEARVLKHKALVSLVAAVEAFNSPRDDGRASQWGRFLPEHTTAVSLLDRLLHHADVVVTDGPSHRMREARAKGGTTLNKT
jgi:hypothetical protein